MLKFHPLVTNLVHKLQVINQMITYALGRPPLTAPYLHVRGVVIDPIPPGKLGRIRIHGSYWFAQTIIPLNWTIPAGMEIKSVKRCGCTLLVDPIDAAAPVMQLSSRSRQQRNFAT